MSLTPSGSGTPPATPLYDRTIAEPSYGDLRSDRVGADEPDEPDDPSGAEGSSPTTRQRAQRTKDATKGAASEVADTAQDAAGTVAATGKDQAARVAKDAMGQARELYGQAAAQLSEQAASRQDRAAGTLRTFADDLSAMSGQAGGGLAAELVESLETRARDVAGWLEQRRPGDVVDEVKRFAAQRPGLFIALAAGTGVVAARLTKALAAEAHSDGEPSPAGTPVVSDR